MTDRDRELLLARIWLAEDHPARALAILERHARAKGRDLRRTR